MKGTDHFKTAIQNHLNGLAAKDELFADSLKKDNKNIDDCITYILNQVKASGCNGFADEEIYQMAVHYYDEDDIAIGKPLNGTVVVNHTATNKSKVNIEKPKKVAKPTKKQKVVEMDTSKQVSLFDFEGV
ncbi:PcfK-like family protein [Flavobacterium sp. CBA20B-1]|uniref:PcfK-like family protein n=1 Tax=unclassified Flavobacterium TaxID=196869 RepID=UPI00222557F0|nr:MULTISPECIES: PcfK-like family protein [unclassified Flavobacterium]WCM42432.1 PcfK-like family protein [Flavobacterium sp. CBA20B-1]